MNKYVPWLFAIITFTIIAGSIIVGSLVLQ